MTKFLAALSIFIPAILSAELPIKDYLQDQIDFCSKEMLYIMGSNLKYQKDPRWNYLYGKMKAYEDVLTRFTRD